MKNTQETVMRKRPKSHQSMLEFICLLKEIEIPVEKPGFISHPLHWV